MNKLPYINWVALLLLAIALLQIYTNGSPLIRKWIRYHHLNASFFLWLNLIAGVVSLVLFIVLPLLQDWPPSQLKKIHLGLVAMNVLFMLAYMIHFWGGFDGGIFNS